MSRDACSWPTCRLDAAVVVHADPPVPLCVGHYGAGIELGCWGTATVTSLSGSLGVVEPEPTIPDRWAIPAAIGLSVLCWWLVFALVVAVGFVAEAIVG